MPCLPQIMPPVGKSAPLMNFATSLTSSLRIVNQRATGVDDFGEIVRRDVRGHADRDARAAVDEQIRDARRQDDGFLFLLVEVGLEIDRVLVEVGEQFLGDLFEAALGVPVGGGRVAVDRAEVALAVDERVAHREILRHADERVVDAGVAVRVVFAEHFTDDLGAFRVGAVVQQAEFAHRVEHAAVGRLQAVAGVGQRAPDDDRHRVVDVGLLHLLADVDQCHGILVLHNLSGSCQHNRCR